MALLTSVEKYYTDLVLTYNKKNTKNLIRNFITIDKHQYNHEILNLLQTIKIEKLETTNIVAILHTTALHFGDTKEWKDCKKRAILALKQRKIKDLHRVLDNM